LSFARAELVEVRDLARLPFALRVDDPVQEGIREGALHRNLAGGLRSRASTTWARAILAVAPSEAFALSSLSAGACLLLVQDDWGR